MNSEINMQSDVLDILFEKRNKLYGAIAVVTSGGEVQKSAEVIIDAYQPTEPPAIEPAYPGGINAIRKFW